MDLRFFSKIGQSTPSSRSGGSRKVTKYLLEKGIPYAPKVKEYFPLI